jgi:hypothetical protein
MLAALFSTETRARSTNPTTSERAAETSTVRENRFAKIENDLVAIKGEVALVKWMVGFALALLTAIVLKLFLH